MKRLLPLVTLLALASPAQAYTPGSFQQELNNTDWGTSGETVGFTNISECRDLTKTESHGVRNPARLQSLEQEYNMHRANAKKFEDAAVYERNMAKRDQLDEQWSYHIELANAVVDKIRREEKDIVKSTSVVGYGCSGGFIKISNPQGTRVCEVSGVAIREGNLNYRAKNCVWR